MTSFAPGLPREPRRSSPPQLSPVPQLPAKPRTWPSVVGILAVLAGVTIVSTVSSWGGVGIDLGAIADNWQNGTDKIGQMLRPDFGILPRTWEPLLQTLQMALVGAAIATAVSVPLSLWAARPTNPLTPARSAVRLLLNVIRAVPDLVYAAILVAMVGVGALPGVITLVLFDIGIVAKLVSESIDSADASYLEAGRAAGGSQAAINRAMALPQSWPAIANQSLYALELNVRVSSILGLVGAGGLGLIIDEVRTFFHYDQLAAIIIEILVVVLIIEFVSSSLRKRLA